VAATRLTPADIRRLAAKLDRDGGVLDDSDRDVLRLVFALAETAVSAAGPRTRTDILLDSLLPAPLVSGIERGEQAAPVAQSGSAGASLLDGFEGAFQPGGAACFGMEPKSPAEAAPKRPAITARLV
jgi:hypothetical protein